MAHGSREPARHARCARCRQIPHRLPSENEMGLHRRQVFQVRRPTTTQCRFKNVQPSSERLEQVQCHAGSNRTSHSPRTPQKASTRFGFLGAAGPLWKGAWKVSGHLGWPVWGLTTPVIFSFGNPRILWELTSIDQRAIWKIWRGRFPHMNIKKPEVSELPSVKVPNLHFLNFQSFKVRSTKDSKHLFHIVDKYWSHIQDGQEFIRRIFRIVRSPTFATCSKMSFWKVVIPRNNIFQSGFGIILELFEVIWCFQHSK